jgi:hypothetical protein
MESTIVMTFSALQSGDVAQRKGDTSEADRSHDTDWVGMKPRSFERESLFWYLVRVFLIAVKESFWGMFGSVGKSGAEDDLRG